MAEGKTVFCFGEIVWDSLPEGLFLGGAPFNVAYHLTRLGHTGEPVSAVGKDFLGRDALRRLRDYGMDGRGVHLDPDHGTGVVTVVLDASRNAQYTIHEDVAWDYIPVAEDLLKEASEAHGLVYGSLAARGPVSRNSIITLLANSRGIRLCDVNLRPPYDDRKRVLDLARHATWIKLNEEELDTLGERKVTADNLESALASFAGLTGVSRIVLTRGGKGAAVWSEGEFISAPAPRIEVVDTVGAGDAFTAGFLDALLRDNDIQTALEGGLQRGAYVASRHGAQPA